MSLVAKDLQGLPKGASARLITEVNAALAAAGGSFDIASLFASATDLEAAVSAIAKGIGVKGTVAVHPVRGRSTANIADLGAFTVAGVDGLTYAAGERIWLIDQSTGAENGIYVVGAVVGGEAPLTRAGDWAAAAVVPTGSLIVIDAGTAHNNSLWMINNTGGVTVGTTTPVAEEIASKARLLATLADTGGAALIGTSDASDVQAKIDAGLTASKKTVTVGHADLTDAVAGEAQVINIGTALPANAVILGHALTAITPFSGGGVAACVLDVGGTDDDAIVKDLELITDAPTEAEMQAAVGLLPQGPYSAQQLVATFTPDGGAALLALTAGSVTITVWYIILA